MFDQTYQIFLPVAPRPSVQTKPIKSSSSANPIVNLDVVLAPPIEIKRNSHRKITPQEQEDVLQFLKYPLVNTPTTTVNHLQNIYRKLKQDDDSGLLPTIRDEELLRLLEIELTKYRLI